MGSLSRAAEALPEGEQAGTLIVTGELQHNFCQPWGNKEALSPHSPNTQTAP